MNKMMEESGEDSLLDFWTLAFRGYRFYAALVALCCFVTSLIATYKVLVKC